MALVHWSWTASGDKDNGGATNPRRYGIVTMVAEMRGEDWRFVAAQNTNSVPGFGPEAGIISPMRQSLIMQIGGREIAVRARR